MAEAADTLDADNPTLRRNLGTLVSTLAIYPVARTRPFFDAMEGDVPGTGALFAATIDPWKCTGCLECIEVCGPGALTSLDQDAAVLETLQDRFEFMTELPNTPKRFYEGSMGADGDLKRLLLDHPNFYATAGGHGGCRGCGEVTAIRLVMATSHALGDGRRRTHLRELDTLLEQLQAKLDGLDPADAERRTRIQSIISTLETRLYLYEGGPTGNGPASTVIANATGCSSVYASTMPYNSYLDPWVNSLFQDSQPLAKGIFEGISAQVVSDVKALRIARLELDDAYDPALHENEFRMLSWSEFTSEELDLLPTVLTIGGDGASYDIGFGAMSRVLASDTPIKILVLDSGAYSNTGGQASTSSYTGQDSDLSRFGAAHEGKHEGRKELGLIASFHPHVFACATSTAMHGHFLQSTMRLLEYPAPAVMDVYTPCGGEQGISESSSNARARLAVESRMHPLFVHDPRRGVDAARLVLPRGQPRHRQDVDHQHAGVPRRRRQRPADDHAADPGRVRPRRGAVQEAVPPARPELEASAVPIHEYVELPRRAAGRPDPVRVRDRRRPAPDQGGLLRAASSPWSRTGGATGRRCSTSRACTRPSSPRCTGPTSRSCGRCTSRPRSSARARWTTSPGPCPSWRRRARRRRCRPQPRGSRRRAGLRPAPAATPAASAVAVADARCSSTRPTSRSATTAAPATRSCRSSSRRPR